MKLRFDSPVVLSFVILSIFTLFTGVFSVPGIFKPIAHIFFHANSQHLFGNLTLLLLLGPALEEKFGSLNLFFMILITAVLTYFLNYFFLHQNVIGASGIAFMMIVLSSFANSEKGRINLSFILVVLLFLGDEVTGLFKNDGISHFSHIFGGVLGCIFGLIKNSLPKSGNFDTISS
jgi:membrane associated rhomboid family serine protease